jgi:toxin FitB
LGYLIDTNVVSEWRKPRPDAGVISWLEDVDEETTFISVITVAELFEGVGRLPAGRRKDALSVWLSETLVPRFDGRILPIDAPTAVVWAQIVVRARSAGRSTEPMDAFIAATAEQHDLTLVTRNVGDFAHLGIRVFNPWRDV